MNYTKFEIYLRNLLTHTVNNLLQTLNNVKSIPCFVLEQNFNTIHIMCENFKTIPWVFTLVDVYVDLVVFTRIAGTLKTGSGGYWPEYYVEKHAICLKDYRIRTFLSIRHADGD